MKVIVHLGPAGSHPVLDVYELQPGQAAYAGPPDASIACGDVWLGSSYHSTFLVGEGGKIYCVVNGKEIIAFTPPVAAGSEAESIYMHNTWIRRLALRKVQGGERLYFSAALPTTQDPNRVSIYWLDQNNDAHVYWQVGKNDLQVPNPCQPGEDFALYPESGQVNCHLGIDYMKRLKYKIKIPYLRPHLVKERA